MAHMNSSLKKNINASEDEEESGWTAYFEDLSCCKEESNFITLSPSLVSDAAWNGSDHVHVNRVKMLSFNNNLKKINNKKYPKNDDDLEDTASSPVNSPKVSNLKHMEVKHRRTHHDVYIGNFLGKQGLSNNNFSRHGDVEKIDNVIKNNFNAYVVDDLEKKGLCLVPTSAFINYFR